jgi:Fe-S-cluster-containing dehydrogenase component/DMSO reductase anchor subunit
MKEVSGFIFDRNKCVGCHACVVACHVENDLVPGTPWRTVYATSDFMPQRASRVYLSLACNHCEQPSCLEACPTAAYTIDSETIAVMFNEELCIGCRYCTWACPFDAPVFNDRSGTIEKCTFCISRIREGRSPACATNCPTGALDYGRLDGNEDLTAEPGFPVTDLRPRIRFRQERTPSAPDIIPEVAEIQSKHTPMRANRERVGKVGLRTEWTLYLFTLMVPLIMGMFAGMVSGYLVVHPLLFALFLAGTLMVSMLHLGHKKRALLALRNLRTSWLSREIFGYAFFTGLSMLHITLLPSAWWASVAGLTIGLFTLYSMDRVYRYFRNPVHSSSALLTGLLWIALILQDPLPLFFIIFIKGGLYIWRKFPVWKQLEPIRKFWSIMRLLLLLFIPVLVVIFDPYLILELFFPLIIGECIDRWEFYTEPQVNSPALELDRYELQQVQQARETI